MTFASAVRSVRLAHNLGQCELAMGLGLACDGGLVRDWESARKSKYGPSRMILRAMFEAEPTFARIAQEIWRLST